MNTQIKSTKTKVYMNFGGQLLASSNSWRDHTVTPLDLSKINDQQKKAIESPLGWEDLGEFETPQQARVAYIEKAAKYREERKAAKFAWKHAAIERNQKAWDEIKDLPVIPATVDNIRTLLNHLNSNNWGGWTLPKLSIGYSANQYDCDGQSATTITLDEKIEFEGELVDKFVVGAPRGHLNKYQML
jgi:hypothetical protein